MPRLDVSCFGEVLWDFFEDARRPDVHVRAIGGAPANVATVLARLGARVALLGGVGRDRFGDDLLAALAREGVDVRHVSRLPNRTGITFVRRDARGEPSFLFYRDRTADVSVGAGDLDAAGADASLGLVGTSTVMTPTLRGATARFARALARAGGALVVDLNVRAHLWGDRRELRRQVGALLEGAAVVKGSSADLAALAGDEAGGERFVARHAPRAVRIVTRGAGPASAIVGRARVDVASLASPRRPCVDATGAGDAFIAGVLGTLAAASARPGAPAWEDLSVWREALTAGHRLGQKAISRPGAVTGVTRLDGARRALQRLRTRFNP